MLREKIAEGIREKYMSYGNCPTTWKDTPYKDYWRSLADVALAFFREEIEKMGVIGDEKIGEAGDWRYEEGKLYADCIDCGLDTERLRAVVQAQLQHDKDTLLRMME